MSMLATLRDIVMLCCWGKPLFIKTNQDVLEKYLQGAVVQEAAGEMAPLQATSLFPSARKPTRACGGHHTVPVRSPPRSHACCRPLEGPPGG